MQDTLLNKLLGQFIERHNTPFFKRVENFTWDCIVLFLYTQYFGKLGINFTTVSIYMKGECGFKKHIHIYIYILYIYREREREREKGRESGRERKREIEIYRQIEIYRYVQIYLYLYLSIYLSIYICICILCIYIYNRTL